jgi:hypothetical protein
LLSEENSKKEQPRLSTIVMETMDLSQTTRNLPKEADPPLQTLPYL